MTVKIHPAVDNGVKPGTPGFAGGTLTCKCTTDPVKVSIEGDVLFNHVCGCSQCWRPMGALFSMIAVVPTPKVKVLANGHKLKVVDPSKTIHRNACTVCGVHMHGPIDNPKHAFNGLTFVHAERFDKSGWAPPAFAAFVSSVIETGTKPEDMNAIRARLKELKLEPYDRALAGPDGPVGGQCGEGERGGESRRVVSGSPADRTPLHPRESDPFCVGGRDERPPLLPQNFCPNCSHTVRGCTGMTYG